MQRESVSCANAQKHKIPWAWKCKAFWLVGAQSGCPGWGRGEVEELKGSRQGTFWSGLSWPDLLADRSCSVFWGRLICVTDGPAGWRPLWTWWPHAEFWGLTPWCDASHPGQLPGRESVGYGNASSCQGASVPVLEEGLRDLPSTEVLRRSLGQTDSGWGSYLYHLPCDFEHIARTFSNLVPQL